MPPDDAEDERHLSDLLLAIADLCGFVPPAANDDAGDDDRLKFVETVSHLPEILRLIQDTDDDEDKDGSSLNLLLEVEETIARVRRDANSFLVSIAEDLSEVLLLEDELMGMTAKSKSGGDLSAAWIVFGRSLILQFRRQCQREEQLVQQLQAELDTIYSSELGGNDGTKAKTDIFQRTIQCMRREELLGHVQFREGVDILLQRQDSGRVNFSQSISNALPGMGNQPCLEQSEQFQVGSTRRSYVGQAARTAWDVFEEFQRSNDSQLGKSFHFSCSIMIVGPEGSGKTHLCNKMEQAVQPSAMVIRPQLPLDVLQATVGESENVLLSILGAIHNSRNQNILVILDDVEHVIGGVEQQPLLRLRSTIITILDSIRRQSALTGNVLIVLTSNQDLGSSLIRLDRIFHLGHPGANERRDFLCSVVGLNEVMPELGPSHDGEFEEDLLTEIVESMLGRSYAEMVQYCRQAIEKVGRSLSTSTSRPRPAFRLQVLRELKGHLQTMTPESLRSGVVDDFVEMRVLTARDLLSTAGEKTDPADFTLPLRGKSAQTAWKALEFSIIIPLCRSKELRNLLDRANAVERRNMMGGVLLHGESGSGKSAIALFCARYAARLLPSVKLIDVSCTSLVHKEVGGSEEAIHRLFKAARMATPCILLLDGIENIAAVRGNDATTEGTMDRVLSTLLVELDGVSDVMSGESAGITVIGITHDAQLIDPALKRPGRLPLVRLSRDWN